MKSSIWRATVRISKSCFDALAPRAREIRPPFGLIHELAERGGETIRVARIDRDRAWAADLGQAAAPRGDERGAAGERLERRAAERLGASRQHHADRGALPGRLDLGIGHVRNRPGSGR